MVEVGGEGEIVVGVGIGDVVEVEVVVGGEIGGVVEVGVRGVVEVEGEDTLDLLWNGDRPIGRTRGLYLGDVGSSPTPRCRRGDMNHWEAAQGTSQ